MNGSALASRKTGTGTGEKHADKKAPPKGKNLKRWMAGLPRHHRYAVNQVRSGRATHAQCVVVAILLNDQEGTMNDQVHDEMKRLLARMQEALKQAKKS